MHHHHQSHDHTHRAGHNHHDADHLHSHPHGETARERTEELQALSASFIDGFRTAEDKTSFLRLSDVPFHRPGPDGLTLHLVDVSIVSNWQIGTASPAFASRELNYMPFPGSMVSGRETMRFTYVSLTHRIDSDLLDMLQDRFPTEKGNSDV